MQLDTLFAVYLKEKRYLKNCSEDTLAYLGYCFKALTKHLAGDPSKESLQAWVLKMREASQTIGLVLWP